ncbi:MAG: phenylacetate--CoA ligase family protein [Candidatus Eiseniibacteriota bacterium]
MLSIVPRALASLEALKAGAPALFTAYAENERRDRRALEALQVERLKRLLVHAGERVPFWRRRFARYGIHPETVRSIRDLAALPPLTERDLLDFGNDLMTDGSAQPEWFRARAMEDNRESLGIWLDQRARRERLVDELRHVTWLGLDWRTPRAVLTGRAENGELLEGAAGRLRGGLRSGVWLHSARIRAEGADFAGRAARANASLLSGPPSALERLAGAIAEAVPEAASYRPTVVLTWGEVLDEDRRTWIESAFGAPVYDAYRTREIGEAAHECRERRGLHVTMERVLIEFVRDGEPADPGEDGEILVTALDNLAMPLLRFRLGDVGCRVPEPSCPCGRTSERILITDGRADELVTTTNGKRVHADWFEWLFESCPGLTDWRVRQDRREELSLDLVCADGLDDATLEGLRREISHLDPALTVNIHFVNAVPRRADARRRPVVSRVPIQWPL